MLVAIYAASSIAASPVPHDVDFTSAWFLLFQIGLFPLSKVLIEAMPAKPFREKLRKFWAGHGGTDSTASEKEQDHYPNYGADDLEERLVDLHKLIIDFQVQSIMQFYRSRTRNFFRGTINYVGWDKMLQDIKESEAAL